jgi:chromosome segregation ATPase
MQTGEQQMKLTVEELEGQLEAVSQQFKEAEANAHDEDEAKEVQAQHEALMSSLQTEIDGYKSVIEENSTMVAELEAAHAATRNQLEDVTLSRDRVAAECASHKELVSRLESQIAEHEQAVKIHQDTLDRLQANHARDIEELRSGSEQQYALRLNSLMSEHAENIKILEGDLNEAREDLMDVATQVAMALGAEASIEQINQQVQDLVAYPQMLADEQRRSSELENHIGELSTINNTIMRDLEAVKSALNDMVLAEGANVTSPYPSVTEQLSIVKKRMAELETKSQKHSRMVEELEDQLQSSFDQAQSTTNRLSTLQTERNAKLEEVTAAKIKVQSELDTIREEYAALQVSSITIFQPDRPEVNEVWQARYDQAVTFDHKSKRTDSVTSQVRKTASIVSLPSPPPAVPLPAIPSVGRAMSPTQMGPPTPVGGRPASNDLASAQHREDQEARIRTIERHLTAEKQLTSTLEEALNDLEAQQNKIKADCEGWRKRAVELEKEVKDLKE